MTTVDFTTQLQERYESINRATLDDITALINRLTNQERKLLWDGFVDSYEYNTPPKRATFKKLMYRLNFNDHKDRLEAYGYCHDCRVGYPNWIRSCPACGKELSIINHSPDRFVPMQQHCGSCQKFNPDVRGASCPYYGRGSDSFPDRASQAKICKTCECFKCCYEEFIIANRPKSYHEMKTAGSFNGGHIPFKKVSKDYNQAIQEAQEKIEFKHD